MAVFHEARHQWQYSGYFSGDHGLIDEGLGGGHGLIAGRVVHMAQICGLIQDPYETYYAQPGEITHLPIRPHMIDYVNSSEFNTVFISSQTPWYKYSYDGQLEVDAIIAETIFLDPTFKYYYPELYNYVISAGDFFNKDKYKPYYGRQMQ